MATCSAHPMCVLRYNTAAVLFWLWAMKNRLGFTLGITEQSLGKACICLQGMDFDFESSLLDGTFWTVLRAYYHANRVVSFDFRSDLLWSILVANRSAIFKWAIHEKGADNVDHFKRSKVYNFKNELVFITKFNFAICESETCRTYFIETIFSLKRKYKF